MFHINPGDLRQKIIINYNAQPDRTNESGLPYPDWKPLTSASIHAKRTGLTGRLFYQAAAAQSEADVLFTIRYRNDVKAGMQIIDGTEVFEITVPPIDPEGRRAWLEIHSRQVLQNGG